MMVVIGLFEASTLSITNLSYSIDERNSIFRDVSLEVKEGEFVSIIGKSGSGKSTLFKLIAGLIKPDSGEIVLTDNKTKLLGEVGYMPQQDLLLPWKTVLENVSLPLEVKKEKLNLEEIRLWLARFGLDRYEHAYPHELSGGMKQRAAFLRTLLTGKDLLLLDEPFGALDSFTKRKMQSWLLGLWDDLQKTILLVTHDLEEALLLSDRILILSTTGIKDWKVNLSRPRCDQVIYQPEFMTMRKELELLIHHES
ncbi:ABC transporter ATP-binding protein [Neobacillus sp. LXY-1]|uniref:ABC transporter ATP-binding protein n=1 Tax=Neobacillus sp. LXY-1 TaxID=3379133 RepID=UPI003EDF3840